MRCRQHSQTIDGIRSLFAFQDSARKAVYELKYNNLRAIAHTMAPLFHDYMLANDISGDVLVPVPLHSSRLRERGYNQSELICRELGKLCNLLFEKKSLVRTQHTKSQTALNRDQRADNVKDVFACKDDIFKGKRVLLIDDVCTTGATLDACAVSLKEKGALAVWGLTFARDL
ncbi:MAG: ComF family protein [Chloroflexi bacterium]|nr:ComF family protein [Chloroflexota bacterium]